jgi:heterodisulfide reductase subunit A-like polyferredoxin
MQALEVPYYPVLRGEEAIKALQGFIREVKEENNEELTFKQTKTLIKVAKELISSIEVTTVSVNKGNEKKHIIKRFKKIIKRRLRN